MNLLFVIFRFLMVGQKRLRILENLWARHTLKLTFSQKLWHLEQKGNIKISYNGKMNGQYGFQSDNIEIQTDDELNPIKSFSVYATLEDNFKDLKPEELAKAPQLQLEATIA